MITLALLLLISALAAAQKNYVNYEFRAAEDAYASILLKKNLSQLATIPFCYRTAVTDPSYFPTQTSNLSWSDYVSSRITKIRRSPVKMSLYLQLLQLVDLSEKDQSLTMVMSTVTTWVDCRLRWDESQFNVSRISLPAQKFKKLQVFSPSVRLVEAIDPLSVADSETGAHISSDGTVVVTREFSVTFSCNIGVEMFPFDIQICYLTFESIMDQSVVNITNIESSVQQESEYLIGRYISSDQWALTVLPAVQTNTNICSDDDETKMDCFTSALKYKLILRRHPTYNLNNLLFPAFLIVLLSSFVFVIPPGAGEKMDLNINILLSFYMFSALMYEKMPETGSVIPLLSQYFLVCTGLISASCLYSAISTVIESARCNVPRVVQNFVVTVGPYLINDQINPSKCAIEDNKNAVKENPKIQSTSKPVEQVRMSYLAEGEDDDDDDEEEDVHEEEFEGFCIDDPREIKWSAVSALLDRCFMILHVLAAFAVLGIYLAMGYAPWIGYSAVELDEKAINYICYQSLHAKDLHDDFNCPDFNFTAHVH